MPSPVLFALVSAVSAFGLGLSGALAWRASSARRKRGTRVRTSLDMPSLANPLGSGAALGLVAGVAAACTNRSKVALPAPVRKLEQFGSARFVGKLRRAGLDGQVSVQGLCRARLLLAACGGCAGALGGLLFTPAFGALACIAGTAAGWLSVGHMLAGRIADRRKGLESHLSQALEVICLGLRAGLSFDRSLALYCTCFEGTLARELQGALSLWQAGMKTREEALRDLAATYDSHVLERTVDGIVRSLRFGSSLADGLEALAQESRQAHRAHVEEEVMKAPVKMMVPVGVLILPSMLMLVLGPVLLDLMNGF